MALVEEVFDDPALALWVQAFVERVVTGHVPCKWQVNGAEGRGALESGRRREAHDKG